MISVGCMQIMQSRYSTYNRLGPIQFHSGLKVFSAGALQLDRFYWVAQAGQVFFSSLADIHMDCARSLEDTPLALGLFFSFLPPTKNKKTDNGQGTTVAFFSTPDRILVSFMIRAKGHSRCQSSKVPVTTTFVPPCLHWNYVTIACAPRKFSYHQYRRSSIYLDREVCENEPDEARIWTPSC